MNADLWMEIFGVLTGLLCVLLQYRASPWFAVVGIVSSSVYVYLFFVNKFYADSAISVYYLGANIFALSVWLKLRHKHPENLNYGGISRVRKRHYLPAAALAIVLTAAIFFVLKYFTDSPVPLGDAATTALSIVAMWFLAQKKIEHWLIWIAVNALSTALYAWKGMYPTVALYSVYVVISLLGYLNWKKELTKTEQENVGNSDIFA